MKSIVYFLLLGFGLLSCNKDEIKIKVDKVENNMIHFTIKNNFEKESIRFLKPKHNYLCYEGGSPINNIYKDFYILDFIDRYKDLKTFKNTHVDILDNNPSDLSNYIIVEINKNKSYSDSIMIPDEDCEYCYFYPIIEKNTILMIRKGTLIYDEKGAVKLIH